MGFKEMKLGVGTFQTFGKSRGQGWRKITSAAKDFEACESICMSWCKCEVGCTGTSLLKKPAEAQPFPNLIMLGWSKLGQARSPYQNE